MPPKQPSLWVPDEYPSPDAFFEAMAESFKDLSLRGNGSQAESRGLHAGEYKEAFDSAWKNGLAEKAKALIKASYTKSFENYEYREGHEGRNLVSMALSSTSPADRDRFGVSLPVPVLDATPGNLQAFLDRLSASEGSKPLFNGIKAYVGTSNVAEIFRNKLQTTFGGKSEALAAVRVTTFQVELTDLFAALGRSALFWREFNVKAVITGTVDDVELSGRMDGFAAVLDPLSDLGHGSQLKKDTPFTLAGICALDAQSGASHNAGTASQLTINACDEEDDDDCMQDSDATSDPSATSAPLPSLPAVVQAASHQRPAPNLPPKLKNFKDLKFVDKLVANIHVLGSDVADRGDNDIGGRLSIFEYKSDLSKDVNASVRQVVRECVACMQVAKLTHMAWILMDGNQWILGVRGWDEQKKSDRTVRWAPFETEGNEAAMLKLLAHWLSIDAETLFNLLIELIPDEE